MKRKAPGPLSDQLRSLIQESEVSRYRIAKDSNVDAGQLCRFMQGKGQLTFETLDRIGQVLGLRFTLEPETPAKQRRSTKKR